MPNSRYGNGPTVVRAVEIERRRDWKKELKDFNERDYNWLYMLLTGDFPEEKVKDVKDVVLDLLDSRNEDFFIVHGREVKIVPNEIRDARSHNIVSDINWIQKDNHRLLIWLLNEILYDRGLKSLVRLPRRLSDISTESRYQKVIECIDSVLSSSVLASKERWLGCLKSRWGKAETHEENTKWIKLQDSVQLKWAWDYLKDRKKDLQVSEPVTPDEHHTAILASLDCFSKCFSDDPVDPLGGTHSDRSAEKALFLIKFKKAWSQKKFRDSDNAKKSYHIPLTIKAKQALKKVAEIKNCTENEVLEDLINREYVGICLDAQGNEKY